MPGSDTRQNHWFWHPNDETPLRSLEELIGLYERSVGHGATLLLNVAPDNKGLFPVEEVQRVIELGDEIKRRYAYPLAKSSGGRSVSIRLKREEDIHRMVIMEQIEHGERVRSYVVEAEREGEWIEIARGSAIGHKKIDSLTVPIRASNIRLAILESVGEPHIRSFSVYNGQ